MYSKAIHAIIRKPSHDTGTCNCFRFRLKLQGKNSDDTEGWEAAYDAYCAAKDAATVDSNDVKEVVQQGESWESQYAAYCAEKEAALNRADQEAKNRQEVRK